MTDTLDGGCACGRLRYRMRSAPMFVHCCHCKDCQRQTGTAFVLNALIETDRIDLLSGEPAPFPMPTDSGRPHRVFRCPDCGTAVWSEYGGVDDAALRPCRHAGRTVGAAARRAHLHPFEAALDRAARRRARVRGLLQFEEAMARRQPGTPQGRAWLNARFRYRGECPDPGARYWAGLYLAYGVREVGAKRRVRVVPADPHPRSPAQGRGPRPLPQAGEVYGQTGSPRKRLNRRPRAPPGAVARRPAFARHVWPQASF